MAVEVILDNYFDVVFKGLDRGCLMARYKRKQLVDYFTTVIEGCCNGEKGCEPKYCCSKAVQSALRVHASTRDSNGEVCLMGKFHNVLYVAVKLCYDWQVNDLGTIKQLLDDIFICEKTFERIFVGAIFGTRVTHLISGWKSDFETREENIKGVTYFLEQATRAKLEFCVGGKLTRFVDVPLESYGRATPIRVAVQAAQPDVLKLLLRFGATVSFSEADVNTCAFHPLLRRLNEYCSQQPQRPLAAEVLGCLVLLLRALAALPKLLRDPCDTSSESVIHPYLIAEEIIPPHFCGITTPPLRHLCRCVIRAELNKNYLLPYGIQQLQLPESIKMYLDLEE